MFDLLQLNTKIFLDSSSIALLLLINVKDQRSRCKNIKIFLAVSPQVKNKMFFGGLSIAPVHF